MRASYREAEAYARSLLASNELLRASAVEAATYATSLEQEVTRQRASRWPDASS